MAFAAAIDARKTKDLIQVLRSKLMPGVSRGTETDMLLRRSPVGALPFRSARDCLVQMTSSAAPARRGPEIRIMLSRFRWSSRRAFRDKDEG